jgi:hypothetical protein
MRDRKQLDGVAGKDARSVGGQRTSQDHQEVTVPVGDTRESRFAREVLDRLCVELGADPELTVPVVLSGAHYPEVVRVRQAWLGKLYGLYGWSPSRIEAATGFSRATVYYAIKKAGVASDVTSPIHTGQ